MIWSGTTDNDGQRTYSTLILSKQTVIFLPRNFSEKINCLHSLSIVQNCTISIYRTKYLIFNQLPKILVSF